MLYYNVYQARRCLTDEIPMRLFLALLLSALSGPALAEVPKVATDLPPVHGLVSRVMEGLGTPALVVPPAASAHSHDLRPSEAAALEQADAVFWVGEALSPWLLRPVETLASDATVVELLDTEGTALLPFREAEEFGADHAGHDHDHGHGHDDIDPHAWLDPANAQHWLEVIAGVLSDLDPENAGTYRANAEAGRAEIDEAFQKLQEQLKGADGIRYLVFHDAYQYFEARFGLEPVGAVTLGDAAAPGPARIAKLQEQLIRSGTFCLLTEPQENSQLIGVLSKGGAMKIVEIDPLGTGVLAEAPFYPAFLASLGNSFDACR